MPGIVGCILGDEGSPIGVDFDVGLFAGCGESYVKAAEVLAIGVVAVGCSIQKGAEHHLYKGLAIG